MAFNVNQFASALKGGGARPSLFRVQITNPVNGVADVDVPFMCKTAQIPGSTLSAVEISYMGRQVKTPGSRTFEDWSVSIINDENFSIRNALEQWSNAINSHEGNLATVGGSNPALYKANATVTQFGKDGEILRVYEFVGVWPQEVGAIELGWESADEIEEYDVTFSYDYWRIVGGNTGDAGGQ